MPTKQKYVVCVKDYQNRHLKFPWSPPEKKWIPVVPLLQYTIFTTSAEYYAAMEYLLDIKDIDISVMKYTDV